MSRGRSSSVTSNSVNNSQSKEEIFLQPIDQQYDKIKETNEVEDQTEFFVDYDQRQNMNKIINMIVDSEFSTCSESYSTMSRYNSLREREEENNMEVTTKPKKAFFTKMFLVEKWKNNVEDLIRKQLNTILGNSFNRIRSQIFGNGNTIRINDTDSRHKFNNYNINMVSESDFFNEIKPSKIVTNLNPIDSIITITNQLAKNSMY